MAEAASHQPSAEPVKRAVQPAPTAQPELAAVMPVAAQSVASRLGESFVDPRIGPSMRAAAVQKLQREHGNQYVQRVIDRSAVTRRPSPSGPGASANRIMRSPAPPAAVATKATEPASESPTTDPLEVEATSAADEVMKRLGSPNPNDNGEGRGRKTATPTTNHATEGRPLSNPLAREFERAFGWDFSGVRLHEGSEAAASASQHGARAFTQGQNIGFGGRVVDPEAAVNRRLLAHELAHVVQQDIGSGKGESTPRVSLSPAPAGQVQAAPLVTAVATSAAELGVGGPEITATATVGGKGTALTWSVVGGAPTGVSIIGSGKRVRVRSVQPGGGTAVGGVPFVLRAQVSSTAGDFFDSPPVMLVQVVSATYAANPPLAAVPSLIPGAPPANTAEPNRDGILGNSAVVNAITLPAGRPVTVTGRRPLGAAIAGTTVTPGAATGDIGLRIADTATGGRLDESLPASAGPAARMADLTVNAVPTKVGSFTGAGALGPYGVLNTINFTASDNLHAPLTRIVGELITNGGDAFNIGPPNGAFNPAFLLGLAVPANSWSDQLITPSGIANATTGLPAIDVNRFVGPGVPQLPRKLIYRQQFQYASWQGGGGVVSNTFADGQHIRSLIGKPGAFQFKTEHKFGAVAAPPRIEPYVGNPLIVLSGVTVTPVGAGGLAADGTATANLSVNSTVPGRTVNWTVLAGDSTITAGSAAALPATATLQAGVRAGTFGVRAADSAFPNRRADGLIRVRAVELTKLRAPAGKIAKGVLTSTVSVNAGPGPRTVNWTVDPAAATAGVTVTPPASGPGVAMTVTVTRPATFKGRVTVTAADSTVPARSGNIRLTFQ